MGAARLFAFAALVLAALPAGALEVERHFGDAVEVVRYPDPGNGYQVVVVRLPPDIEDMPGDAMLVELRFADVQLLDCNVYRYTTPSPLDQRILVEDRPALDYFVLDITEYLEGTYQYCPDTLQYRLLPVPHDAGFLPLAREYVVYVPESVVVTYRLWTPPAPAAQAPASGLSGVPVLDIAYAWADTVGADRAPAVAEISHACIDAVVATWPPELAAAVIAAGGLPAALAGLRESNPDLHDAAWPPILECMLQTQIAAEAWTYIQARAAAFAPAELGPGATDIAWACAVDYLATLAPDRRIAIATFGLQPAERYEIDYLAGCELRRIPAPG